MSTYNGEQYLAEQIESVLNQEGVCVDLLVRDDGSTDHTVAILKAYESVGKLRLITGANLRPAQSFRYLVDHCDLEYDFYAYCDQDDIWEICKLRNAVREMSAFSVDTPTLWYCGLVQLVGTELRGTQFCTVDKATSFEAVVDCFATTNGCTMVFNKHLLLILRSCKQGEIDLHDSWTHAMCLSCGGKILANETPLVRYRIHENQVTGKQTNSLFRKIQRFIKPAKRRKKTVEVMLSSGCLTEKSRAYLELLADYDKNMRHKATLLRQRRHTGLTGKEYIKFKIQILTNRY